MARQRVAAYAVITRGQEILLCRLAPKVSSRETWHLPGGGVDFGEHPADAVVREVREETGLDVSVGEVAHIASAITGERRSPRHAIRLYYDAVLLDPLNAIPVVQEVDGSTVDARWFALEKVRAGAVRLSGAAHFAIENLTAVAEVQRSSAYGVAVHHDQILLTRLSSRTHRPGAWTLPGGGVDHGEAPIATVVREFAEETGLVAQVDRLLDAHSVTLTGTAPSGRTEDFHGIQLLFAVTVDDHAEPQVVETGGTTDAARWVPISDVRSGALPVLDVVRVALDHLQV